MCYVRSFKAAENIKESYTNLESTINSGYSIVFVWKVKAKYEEISFEGINSDLKKAFKKLSFISAFNKSSEE